MDGLTTLRRVKCYIVNKSLIAFKNAQLWQDI
jgi:hypothetical protein